MITHHIEFTKDANHNVDLKRIDKSRYIVTGSETSPYGPYVSKVNLPLPWINCLWCDYRDKNKFDLLLHFLEEHKDELLAIPITSQERLAAKALIQDPRARFFAKFGSPMEYRLDKAVGMAEEGSRPRSKKEIQ